MMLSPWGHGPRLDPEDRREIGKAVAIAGFTTLVTKGVEWGVEWLRKRLTPELDEQCEKCSKSSKD